MSCTSTDARSEVAGRLKTGMIVVTNCSTARASQRASAVRIAPVNLRRIVGALIYDWMPFELRMRGFGSRAGKPEPWLTIHNREETIEADERGVACHWRFTSDLHIANVFPSTARRLMRRSLERWPIAMREAPETSGVPRVSFIIGHRGTERLPHLLATLRSIAG